MDGALEVGFDDVHDVVDGGGDEWGVGERGYGGEERECEVGGGLVELEGFLDRAADEEGCHCGEGREEPGFDFGEQRRVEEDGRHGLRDCGFGIWGRIGLGRLLDFCGRSGRCMDGIPGTYVR